MTREHAKELLPIITAFANGEDVQVLISDNYWSTMRTASFEGPPDQYRIAPKPRKLYINEYPGNGPHRFDAYASKEVAEKFAGKARIASYEIDIPPLP